ncbi:MAG: alpha-mannosidase [Chloroflexota bacterium]
MTDAVLVSTTHWDRAWYQPFQVFRLRLVRLLDRLLDILQEDPAFHSFMLDGQMLPLEDYLEIRPQRRGQIEQLVQQGRLIVGPWYVLADEYLVSPESLIRNLQIGIQQAQALGGVMCEGYVPDSFGHVSQLPQILRGFGIESALFWRGVGQEGERLGVEFWWEAPDGSRVLAINLRDGYHNAGNLGYPMRWGDPGGVQFDMDLAYRRLREAVDFMAPLSRSGTVLLLNGVDHAEAEARVPQIVRAANNALDDVHIEHGTLSDYIARVRAVGDDLPSFRGEFNRDQYAHNLQGVYSSRMYLQQANEQAQTSLECYAEPLSAWAWLLGNDYPDAFLSLAWRKLLQNHPHDDICGCSVDAVHREDMARFDEVKQLGGEIAKQGLRDVTRRIDRSAQDGVPFIFYNPFARPRRETVEVDLTFDPPHAVAGDFHLVDATGRPVPSQLLEQETIVEAKVGQNNPVRRARLAVSLDALPACGYRVLYARSGPQPQQPAIDEPVRLLADGAGMENGLLRVEIASDGALNVLDKRHGRRYEGLAFFVDDEDAGDEYDYSPARHPQRISSQGTPANVRLLHEGPLQVTYEINQELALPVSLSADRQRRSSERVACPLRTRVTLRRSAARLDLQTTVENRARDHRLRVCFPTHIQTGEAHADGHFDVLARPIEAWAGDGHPVPTRHQRYFVDVSDGEQGLAIFNRGLAEVEILPDEGRNTIALTLLRCVGDLSRGDLRTRPEQAGPAVPTPEAQCLGRHTFEYAIVPHTGDWRAVYGAAYAYRAPVVAHPGAEQVGYLPSAAEREAWPPHRLAIANLEGDLPGEQSFLSLEPPPLMLSAVKQSEDGGRLIVRFYNPTAEEIDGALRTFAPIRSAQVVNLDEEPQQKLAVSDERAVRLVVGAGQVQTVALRLAVDAAPAPARP